MMIHFKNLDFIQLIKQIILLCMDFSGIIFNLELINIALKLYFHFKIVKSKPM
jgi:hypothetical protein